MILVEEVRQILSKVEGGGIGPRAMGSCSGSDTLGSTPYSTRKWGCTAEEQLGGQWMEITERKQQG